MNEANDLLKQVIQELRGMRRELAAIRTDVALLTEEKRQATRLQSPFMGRDLFRGDVEDGSTKSSL